MVSFSTSFISHFGLEDIKSVSNERESIGVVLHLTLLNEGTYMDFLILFRNPLLCSEVVCKLPHASGAVYTIV